MGTSSRASMASRFRLNCLERLASSSAAVGSSLGRSGAVKSAGGGAPSRAVRSRLSKVVRERPSALAASVTVPYCSKASSVCRLMASSSAPLLAMRCVMLHFRNLHQDETGVDDPVRHQVRLRLPQNARREVVDRASGGADEHHG